MYTYVNNEGRIRREGEEGGKEKKGTPIRENLSREKKEGDRYRIRKMLKEVETGCKRFQQPKEWYAVERRCRNDVTNKTNI